MATVYFLQPTDMTLLPTGMAGSVSYDPAFSSKQDMLATYNNNTGFTSDDVRIGYYGFFVEIPPTVGTITALSVDVGIDSDPLPNFFIDGVNLGFNDSNPPYSTKNILGIVGAALAGADDITGSSGVDGILGFGGGDAVNARGGADAVFGGDGKDRLDGATGNDDLFGQGGADLLLGGDGADELSGGANADVLVGGLRDDVLRGGASGDRFNINSPKESRPGAGERDIIEDFNRSEGDRIDLSTIDANTKKGGDQKFEFIGGGSFTGNKNDDRGELRAVDSGAHVRLFADVNGDKKADMEIFVRDVASIGSGDFFL